MTAIWTELRYAARSLAREPGFACVALLTVAFGVGANTAIFSIVNSVLLRPLTYAEPESLAAIDEIVPRVSHLYPLLPVNAKHYLTWRERCSSFTQVGLLRPATFNLTGAGEPERLGAALVSANFFTVLGVKPQRGRAFLEEEDQPGHEQVVVITDSLWRRRFQADPALVGRTITLNDKAHVVAGILPESFRFPRGDQLGAVVTLEARTEVFRPVALEKELAPMGEFNYAAIARLRPGVSRERALAELNVVQAAISRELPEKMELRASLVSLQDQVVGPVRQGLLVLLARSASRRRESAIRTALGASRGRLVRETLAGSLLLSLLGGALGVLVAYWGLSLLIRHAPLNLPRLDEIRLDARVMAFALLLSTATGLLFGILPAWRAASTQPQEALKTGSHTVTEGGRGVRLRDALVTLEVGLSLVLLALAGLLLGSFVRLMRVDKGFEAEKLLAADLALPSTRYGQRPQRDRFLEQVLAKVRPLPGVVSAGVVSALPLQGETWVDIISVPGDNRPIFERPLANYRFISPGYFETMRIPLRLGRTLEERDRGKSVALVAERVAQRIWPGENPIGKRFRRGNPDEPAFEVIGVVKDVRVSLQKDPPLMVYVPYWRRLSFKLTLLVRTAMDPRAVATAVRAAIWSVDSEVPVPAMRTMEDVLDDAVAERRFQMLLAASFAVAALLLAALGIYGVVSYSVARRTNEMGIRMALGAGSANLRRMVLRQGLAPVWLGLALGLAAALALGRVVRSLLFGVSPADPLTLGAVALLLLAVAAGACLVPAVRATRVDPTRALRYE